MPLQFQIYNLTQCRKPFTQWKLLHKYMPQFAVGAEHVENIEKLMRYYRKRFHRYTCISGKGSWISPSGFFFFFNSWFPQLLKSYTLKSVVPDSFLPQTGVGPSTAFPEGLLVTAWRSVPYSWFLEEGEGLSVCSPNNTYTPQLAAPVGPREWSLHLFLLNICLHGLCSQFATICWHLLWRFCGYAHTDIF